MKLICILVIQCFAICVLSVAASAADGNTVDLNQKLVEKLKVDLEKIKLSGQTQLASGFSREIQSSLRVMVDEDLHSAPDFKKMEWTYIQIIQLAGHANEPLLCPELLAVIDKYKNIDNGSALMVRYAMLALYMSGYQEKYFVNLVSSWEYTRSCLTAPLFGACLALRP